MRPRGTRAAVNGENPSARTPSRHAENSHTAAPSPTGERPTANTENSHAEGSLTHRRTADRQHREPPHRSHPHPPANSRPPTARTPHRGPHPPANGRPPTARTPTANAHLSTNAERAVRGWETPEAEGRGTSPNIRRINPHPHHIPPPRAIRAACAAFNAAANAPTPRPHPNQRPLPPLPPPEAPTRRAPPPRPAPTPAPEQAPTPQRQQAVRQQRETPPQPPHPRHRSHPRHRRKPQLPRSASSRTACPTGSHRTSACTGRRVGSATTTTVPRPPEAAPANPPRSTAATRPPRPADQAARASPTRRAATPPHTLRRQPARRPAYSPPTRASPARCRAPCSRPDVRTGTAGNARPNSSAVRRAPRSAPATGTPALGAVPGGLLHPAPPTAQHARVLPLQRPRTVPTPRGGPTLGARHPRHIPPPGHLHQHGPVLQPLPHGLPRQRGQPRGPSGLVPRQVPVPTVRTSGAANRTWSRDATNGLAHPLSTSCAASTVQLQLPNRNPHLS